MEQESGATMFSAEFKERAFKVYAAMREKGPVAGVTLPTGEPIWFVTRYAEAMALLKDDERFANDPSNALTEEEYVQLFQQATEHLTVEQQEAVLHWIRARRQESLQRTSYAIHSEPETTLPPRMVAEGRNSFSSETGRSSGSRSQTIRSASFPGSIVPLRPSSKST